MPIRYIALLLDFGLCCGETCAPSPVLMGPASRAIFQCADLVRKLNKPTNRYIAPFNSFFNILTLYLSFRTWLLRFCSSRY